MTKKLTAEEKLNRKPIHTACVFCHEKHLQCDVGRPCQNCLKRGIGDTCRDKERKPRVRGSRKTKKEVIFVKKLDKVKVEETKNEYEDAKDEEYKRGAMTIHKNKAKVSKESKSQGVKRGRISKLSMDSVPLPLPLSVGPASPSDLSNNSQKKVSSPELTKIPSLTQLFNPIAETVITDSLLSSAQNSASHLPSLVDKIPMDPKEKPHISLENDVSSTLNNEPDRPEFGSVWTTEEYTKLNDMLSTPNLSRNNSKTFLNSGTTWSPNLVMRMDSIMESPHPINPQDLLTTSSNALKRTHSRPHISLNQLSNETKRESLTDTSPESQGGDKSDYMTPYKFRQLIKTPEDLYHHEDIVQPHNYKSAYLELLKFLRSRFIGDSKASLRKDERDGSSQLQHIAHSIKTHYAPIFVTLTTNLIAQDLKLQELILQRALLEYENMARLVNCTPMCIWRRSGEICFASNEFISLTGFNKKEILNKRKFIMEFMDNESILDYYEIFHEYLAFGSKQSGPFNALAGTSDGQAVFSECNLLLKNGCFLRCSCIWTVKRDGFNIPMLVMGQFLPIFDFE